jgi:hypothetical protein
VVRNRPRRRGVTPILLEPEVREMMKPMGEDDNLKRADCVVFGKELLGRVLGGSIRRAGPLPL